MNNRPLKMRPMFHFNLLQFVLIFSWSIFAFSIGWERLAVAHSDPLGWFIVLLIIVGGLSFPLLLISWYMKQQVEPHDLQWTLKQQEITLTEYEQLYLEYLSKYSHLISCFDSRDFFLYIVILLSTIFVPFFMSLGIATILMAPFVLGVFIILYGLSLSRFSFKILPSSSNIQTSLKPPRRLRKIIHASAEVDGVAFAGVGLNISESSGFYQISDVEPIFRLEGIESASRVRFDMDNLKLIAETTFLEQPIEIQYREDPSSLLQSVQHIMHLVYREYVANKGSDPILDDLLSELEIDVSDI